MPWLSPAQKVRALKNPANNLVQGNPQRVISQNPIQGTPILPGQSIANVSFYNVDLAMQHLVQILPQASAETLNFFQAAYHSNPEAFSQSYDELRLQLGNLDALEFCKTVYHGLAVIAQSRAEIPLTPQEVVLIYKIGELAQTKEVSPEALNILVSDMPANRPGLENIEGFDYLITGLQYIIQSYQDQNPIAEAGTKESKEVRVKIAGVKVKLVFNGNRMVNISVDNKADLPRLVGALIEVGKAIGVVHENMAELRGAPPATKDVFTTALRGIREIVLAGIPLAKVLPVQVGKAPLVALAPAEVMPLSLQHKIEVFTAAYRVGNLVKKMEELPPKAAEALKACLAVQPRETLQLLDPPENLAYFASGYEEVIEKPVSRAVEQERISTVDQGNSKAVKQEGNRTVKEAKSGIVELKIQNDREETSKPANKALVPSEIIGEAPTPPLELDQIKTAIEAGKYSTEIKGAVRRGDTQALAVAFKKAADHPSLPPKVATVVIEKTLAEAGPKAIPVILAAYEQVKPEELKGIPKQTRKRPADQPVQTESPEIVDTLITAILVISQQPNFAPMIPFIIQSLLAKAETATAEQRPYLMSDPEALVILNSQEALPHLIAFAERSQPAWVSAKSAPAVQISVAEINAKRMAMVEELIFEIIINGRSTEAQIQLSQMGVTAGLETMLRRMVKDNPPPPKNDVKAAAAYRRDMMELSRGLLAWEKMVFEERQNQAREELLKLLEAAAAANLKLSFDHCTLGYIYAGILFDKTFNPRKIQITKDIRTAGNLNLILDVLEAQIHTAVERDVKELADAEISAEFFLYGIIMRKVEARKAKAAKIIAVLQNDKQMWDDLLASLKDRDFTGVAATIDALILTAKKISGLLPDETRKLRVVRLPFSEEVLKEALSRIQEPKAKVFSLAA